MPASGKSRSGSTGHGGATADRNPAVAPTLHMALPGGLRNSPVYDALTVERVHQPSVLVAYPYVRDWLAWKHEAQYRCWSLDSGAVRALRSGVPMDIEGYTRLALELQTNDPTLADVFAMDVIGDWRRSLRNTEWMWKRGVRAVPCWHAGEPEHVLLTMARDYPKLAVGGMKMMRRPQRMRITEQVFARIWPKRVHGFAVADEYMVMRFPYHSVDATSWQLGAMKFWVFRSLDNRRLRVPFKHLSLRGELAHYLALEHRMQRRWGAQMLELE